MYMFGIFRVYSGRLNYVFWLKFFVVLIDKCVIYGI